MSAELAKYDAMCRAIDAAFEFDEVKAMRDQARMLEAAAHVAGNTDAEDRCYKIRRRAERRAAILYDQQEKAKGGQPHQATGRSNGPVDRTLADLGTTKQDMSEWRKLADVSPKQFEQAFAGGGRPTIAQIAGNAERYETRSKPVRSPTSTAALWVWGMLEDFEIDGVLKMKPSVVRKEMHEHQTETIDRLIPEVVKWLEALKRN